MSMSVRIDINRLHIAVHGVSAQLVEEALQGLDTELDQRLNAYGIGPGIKTAGVDISELAIDPVHVETVLDVAGLRGLIADRVFDAITTQAGESAGVSDGGAR